MLYDCRVFSLFFCFTWEEIGEKIINTMCNKSLLIQTCDSTLNAEIATADIAPPFEYIDILLMFRGL